MGTSWKEAIPRPKLRLIEHSLMGNPEATTSYWKFRGSRMEKIRGLPDCSCGFESIVDQANGGVPAPVGI